MLAVISLNLSGDPVSLPGDPDSANGGGMILYAGGTQAQLQVKRDRYKAFVVATLAVDSGDADDKIKVVNTIIPVAVGDILDADLTAFTVPADV